MTITEIAKLAGTSRGTVDRVINNGRGKVNKELEARIKEIIRENEYEVNGSARALSIFTVPAFGARVLSSFCLCVSQRFMDD